MRLATRTIAGDSPGPHVLVTAGVHGDEYEPMAAARRLAASLDPARLRGRVTVVPVVNEPAFRLGRRTADDGLDLARTCPGRADGSVTERVAAAVSDLIRSADFLLDLHTGGARYTLAPLAGYTLHPDPAVLAAQRRMAAVFGFPLVWGTDPSLPGRTLSVARDAGVPAVYTESGGGGGFDPAGVPPLVAGCLRVLGELGLTDRPPPGPGPRVVEDPRPASGYLQGCHPSPADGFFEPRDGVRVGGWVRAGDRLGEVCDPLGDAVAPVVAAASGILIGLHTRAAVRAGDGLAVVVEAEREDFG
jgi:predicted deacylase